jgi:uncharacterized protein YaaQ
MKTNPTIHYLMTAVIQIQDVEKVENVLTSAGMYATRISSTGGFLGHRNVTLLIGLSKDQVEEAIHLLSQYCQRRVEYLATRLEGAPFHPPMSTPVTVGGATIFMLEVVYYEEIL